MRRTAPTPTGAWVLTLASGIITLALGAAAVAIPLLHLHGIPRAGFVGGLLMIAGVAELLLGLGRRLDPVGQAAIASGVITAIAGLVFVLSPQAGFYPVVPAVAVWLFLRGAGVLVAAIPARRDVAGKWLMVAGGTDLLLGLLLLNGLQVTTFAVVLFGPAPEMIGAFALVLALSFVVTGASQVGIALAQRRQSAA